MFLPGESHGQKSLAKIKEFFVLMIPKIKIDPVYSIGSQFITDIQRGYFQIQIEHLSNNPIR